MSSAQAISFSVATKDYQLNKECKVGDNSTSNAAITIEQDSLNPYISPNSSKGPEIRTIGFVNSEERVPENAQSQDDINLNQNFYVKVEN